MKRRQFIALIGGAAAAWPFATRAQQSKPIPRIGVLWHAGSADEEEVYLSVLVKAFNDLGYVEGKNIHLDHRFPAEKPERFQILAKELVDEKPDVIIAVTGFGAAEAKRASSTIPIVVTVAYDAVGMGLVESLARPGGNVTGLSLMAVDLSGKRLELLKEAVPSLSRVALLVDFSTPNKESTVKLHQTAAQALGITLWPAPDDIEPAFAKIAEDRADPRIGAVQLARASWGVSLETSPASNDLRRRGSSTRPSDVVWPGRARFFPPHGGLRRQNTQRSKACRSSRRAANEVQAGP